MSYWSIFTHFYTVSSRKSYAGWGGALQSFKVIKTGINRKPVCDFLSVFHSNYIPNFYHFWDIAIYWLKICISSPFYSLQFHLQPSSGVFPCDLGYKILSSNASPCTTLQWKAHDATITSFGSIPECDRRMDRRMVGQTCHRLPASLRSPELSLFTFRRNLKTHLMGGR